MPKKLAVTVRKNRYSTLTDCLQVEFGFRASKGKAFGYTCPIDQAWRNIRSELKKAGSCKYQGKVIRLSQ